MLLFLFGFGIANPSIVLDQRKVEFISRVRDIAYTIKCEDTLNLSFSWARGYDAYRITVEIRDTLGRLKDRYFYVFKNDTTYKFSYYKHYKEITSRLETLNLAAYNWILFLPHYKWTKKGNPSEVSFTLDGVPGGLYVDKEGRIKKVVIKYPDMPFEIVFKKYEEVAGFKYFPSEWEVNFGDFHKVFKVDKFYLNQGLCGPCTFKIPRNP